MNKFFAVAGWIGGRFLIAMLVFQILGVGSPWESALSPTVRLLTVVAIPGSIEILVIGAYLIDETSGF